MKEGWEIKKLGELFDVQSSKRVHKKDWKSEGIPFYRAREVVKLAKNGFVENELFISEELFNGFTKDKGAPKEDDIIVSAVGTLGQCYLVQKQDKFYIKDASVLWLSKKGEINSRYIEYSFKAPTIQEQVLDRSMGATVGTLTISRAKNIKIPIPPLPEQQRIVSILDRAFAAIDKAKANAEQNLKNAKELFESYLQGVFGGSTSSPTKREGWEEKKLGEIFEIKPSKKEAKDKLSETDLVSFLPMEDLGVCENEIKATKEKQFKEVAGSYTYFAENDVLLAKITPCFENGKLGVAKNLKNGVGFGSSEYIVFRCPENIAPEFLFYFLSRESLRTIGKKYMSGAVGHKRVSKDWIENYLFSYPKSKEEQRTIIRQLDALRAETQKLEAVYQKKLDDLEELKKSILQKAFAGELETEKVVAV
jgi:type I restriction enzyme S subunit